MSAQDDISKVEPAPFVGNLNDPPPAYDAATSGSASASGKYPPSDTPNDKDLKGAPPAGGPPFAGGAGPAQAQGPATTVYNYVNPVTGEVVTSLLPPDHPQMVCLQEGHVPHSRFGLLGILAAVVWFPIGIACCFLDRKVECRRCGQILEPGLCD